MYLQLKISLLQQHLLGRHRAASKVTKAVIKATTKVVTKLYTKGTKVGTKAKEKDTREAVNRMKMTRRVVVVNQLQIMVKIMLVNVNPPKNVHFPYPHRLQRCLVVDSKQQQSLKRENQGRKSQL